MYSAGIDMEAAEVSLISTKKLGGKVFQGCFEAGGITKGANIELHIPQPEGSPGRFWDAEYFV
jgi:hypothetical protein